MDPRAQVAARHCCDGKRCTYILGTLDPPTPCWLNDVIVTYSEILYKSTAEIRVPQSNGWVKNELYDFLIEIRLS